MAEALMNQAAAPRSLALQTPRLSVVFFDPTPPSLHPAQILSLYASVTKGQFGLKSEPDVIERARNNAVPRTLFTKGVPPGFSYHMLYLRSSATDNTSAANSLEDIEGENVFIGFTSVYVRPPSTALQLGYAILPTYQGQGYATEAVSATLRYWFDVLCMQVIEALTTEGNAGSMRVAEKCGAVMVDAGEEGEDGAEVWGKEKREWARKMHGTAERLVEYVFTKECTDRALR